MILITNVDRRPLRSSNLAIVLNQSLDHLLWQDKLILEEIQISTAPSVLNVAF